MSKSEKQASEGGKSRGPAISIGVPSPPVYAGATTLRGSIDPGWNAVDQAPWAVDGVTVDGHGVSYTAHSWQGLVNLNTGKNIVTAVVDAEGHKGRSEAEIDALGRPVAPTIVINAPQAPIFEGSVGLTGAGNAGFDPAANGPYKIQSVSVQVDQQTPVPAQFSGQSDFTWSAQLNLSAGTHTITATVRTAGPASSATIQVQVQRRSLAPTIHIDPPSTPVLAGELQLAGTGSAGLDGSTNQAWTIQSVTIVVDQVITVAAQWNGGSDFTWESEVDLATGLHTITATVQTNGPTASTTIEVDVVLPTVSPTIAIDTPQGPIYPGVLQVLGSGDAGQDGTSGAPWTIQAITVQVDQGPTVAAQYTGTSAFTWSADVALVPGPHMLTAVVHTNGPSATASIEIDVEATAGVPVKGWQVVSKTVEFSHAEVKPTVVVAPPGTRVVGGGYFPVNQQGSLRVLGSWPSDPSGGPSTDGSAWSVYAANTNSQETTPKPSMTVYAICAQIDGLQVIMQTATFAPGETKDVLVACPPGKRVVGGGWFPKDHQGTLVVEGSWPSDAHASRTITDGSAWAIHAHNPETTSSPIPPSLIAYAICANEAEGWQAVSTEGKFTAAEARNVSVLIPSGKRLLSGGFVTTQGTLVVEANAPATPGNQPADGSEWLVYARETAGTPAALVAFAICARVS